MNVYDDWKTAENLPDLAGLPDPLVMQDGHRVSTAEEWQEQREYLKQMLAHYLYGHMPLKPSVISGDLLNTAQVFQGRATEKIYRIHCGSGENQLSFKVRLVCPEGVKGFPVVIQNSPDERDVCPIEEELVAKRGYALAVFNRIDLAPDSDEYNKHTAAAYPGYDWKTIAIWAWGHMRTLDFLETLGIDGDFSKVCVTGHSRGGKTALCAGIFDERFAVVVPNGSGCGGAGCLRVLGGCGGFSQNPMECESVGRITTVFPHWWSPELNAFGDGNHPHNLLHETRLPFDSHTLRALIAPRVCLSTDGFADEWANPYGTQLAWQAAQPVFDFLGAGGNNLLHVRDGVHEQNAEDWLALADCCDKAFFRKQPGVEFNKARFDIPLHEFVK